MGFQIDPTKQSQFASREEAEAAFKQSDDRLRFAMEAVKEGVWDWDVPSGCVYCSPTYFRLLGYAPEEGLCDHSNWIDMVHPDDQARAWEANQACVDGLTDTFETEFRMRHSDGGWRWIKSSARCVARAADGTALRLVGTHTDVTGQKVAESSLRVSEANLDESEARYRVMFEKATDPLFIEALDGAVLDCNDAACRLFGYTRAEFLQLNAADLVTPEIAARLPDLFQQVHTNGGLFVTGENTKKNGEVFPVEVNLQQVTIQNEPRVIVSIHDISQRIHSEKIQAALYQISEAAQSVADLDQLYQRIHGIIAGLMYAKNFYIALYDEASGLLSFPYAVDELDPTPMPQKPRRGMTEYVLRSGQPLLATPELYTRLIQEGAIEAIGAPSVDWLGVPLKNQEKTFGMMALQTYNQQVRYTLADQDVLVFISAQIASAIQRKRSAEQIRKLNKTLHSISQINQVLVRAVDETELMQRVCQVLVDSGDYPLVWIGLLETDPHQSVRPVVLAGEDCGQLALTPLTWCSAQAEHSPTAEAVRSGKPVLRNFLFDAAQTDTQELPSDSFGYAVSLILPLVSGGQAFGAAYVYSSTADAFNEEETQLLSQMADDLAFGITALRERIQRQQAVQALSESEEKYRSVVERANDGIAILKQGTVVFANQRLAELWGGSLEEITGRPLTDFVAPEFIGMILQNYHRRMAGESIPQIYTTQLCRKDGSLVDAQLNTGLLNFQGSPAELIIIRDVTDQKQAETERAQRLAELEAINRISTALRTAQNLEEMLPRLLDETLAVMNTPAGAIWLYSQASGELRPVASRSWFSELAKTPKKTNEGIGGMVFTTGQAYFSKDFSLDPNTRITVRDQVPPGWGGACIPIYSSTERVGIFYLGLPTQRAMKQEETHLLLNLAEIAGNAIHRMRLHAQAELHVQRLNALRLFDMAITTSLDLRLTLDVLLEQATSQLGVDAADVLLLNDTTKTLEYAAGRGFRTSAARRSRIHIGEGLAGKAARDRKTFHVDEPGLVAGPSAQGWMVVGEKFKSYYGVPLISKGKIEGVLELFHREHLAPDLEWLDFLETLAGQAAIAIDDAQLFESLQRSNAELMLAYDIFIEGLSRTLELRHLETQGHSQRVTDLTLNLAREMRVFNEETLVAVRRGAILHDIGKICVPDSILLKPGKLDAEEWVTMRKHPDYANDMLAPIGYLGAAVDIPYCHHEKWDGSGYPRGLMGEQIPLPARIFAVIDVWDALTNDRVYNQAWPVDKVRDYILSQSGTHFDPQVVSTFIHYLDSGKIRTSPLRSRHL